MEKGFKHIFIFMLSMLGIIGTTSCEHSVEEEEIREPEKVLLVLRISPVSAANTQSNGGVTERVKSFRIVVLGEDVNGKDSIECNEKHDTTLIAAQNFKYDKFVRRTKPGKKKIYIFANEESIEKIWFASSNELPNDLPTNLTDLLEFYKPGSTDAKEFEKVINSVYFAPRYPIDGDKNIYLPYTSFYEVTVEEAHSLETEVTNSQTMYIVPVATKFFFRFYNYHKQPVEIKNLSIKSIASENFLLGQVDETDQKKTFGDSSDEYYWVDWLAKVAEEIHNSLSPDNGDINDEYGWISAYQMPKTNKHEEAILISEEKENVKTIPVWTDDNEEALYLGPYYFPESHNDEEGNTLPEQDYIMSLHLHDTETGSPNGDFKEDLRIGNLKALFRDTCVLIQVTMRAGDVEVYAEMAPWEHKEVEGWAEGGSIIP